MTDNASPWAVGWQTLPWKPQHSDFPMSRAQRAVLHADYRAAVPANISSIAVDVSPGTVAAADDARAEVSRFDAELSHMLPGAEFAPLAAVLLRTESASSSQIENITARAKSLALAEIGIAKYGSNAKLVAANVDAMNHAIKLPEAITPESILAIHESLMREQSHANPGSFRTEQVWIGGGGFSPHNASFVPPHHSRIEAAIEDLCAFIARTDVPLMVQASIAHAQFETIHPFNDGNGRTGRALVHAMLKLGGATTRATIPVSAGLLADTRAYFDALTAYRNGNLDPIVEQFTEATFAAIRNGRRLSQDLLDVYERWISTVKARKNSSIWVILPYLLSQPAVTSVHVQELAGLSQPAADKLIEQLRDAGIIAQASGGQRYRVWVATEVTDALDTFADRARRATEA